MSNEEHSNSAEDVAQPKNMDLMIAQYTALREEIVKRIEIEYQLLALTLTASGIILTVGLQTRNAPVMLILPILILFLSAVWTNNETSITGLGAHIRNHIESPEGWEHKLPQNWKGIQRVTGVGSGAIFISTELLAILTGLSVATFSLIVKVLLALDVLSILLSAVLLIWLGPGRHKNK